MNSVVRFTEVVAAAAVAAVVAVAGGATTVTARGGASAAVGEVTGGTAGVTKTIVRSVTIRGNLGRNVWFRGRITGTTGALTYSYVSTNTPVRIALTRFASLVYGTRSVTVRGTGNILSGPTKGREIGVVLTAVDGARADTLRIALSNGHRKVATLPRGAVTIG